MEDELLQSQLMSNRDTQNKKKRTKVTDTRLSPRAAPKSAMDQQQNSGSIKPEFTLDPAKAAFDGKSVSVT